MHIESIKSMMECLTTKANAQLSGDVENVDTHEMGEVIDMIKDLAEAKYYCTITKEMEEAKEEEETLIKAGVIEPSAVRYYNDNRYQNGRYAPDGNTMTRNYMGRRGYTMPYYPDEYDPANEFYMNKWRLGSKPRYYDGGNGSGSSNGSSGNSGGGSRGYSDGNNSGGSSGVMRGYDDGYMKGRMDAETSYSRAKRFYTESKQTHSGNTTEDKNAKLQSLDEYIRELGSDIAELVRDASPDEKSAMKQKIATLASKIS